MDLQELISFERIVPPLMRMLPMSYVQHIARYNFAVPYCANKLVLDAACGTGYGTAMISNVASGIVGVDRSATALDFARKFNRFFGKWELRPVDLDRDRLEGSFDVVLSFETIEHLNQPRHFLEQVRHCDCPFLFSIPSELDRPHHNCVYTFDDYQRLLDPFFRVEWYGQCDGNILKHFDPKDICSHIGVAQPRGK
jgi:SAM-dependent methyltransferase